jgi:hypothetical protein
VLGEGLAVLRRRQAKLPTDDPYLSLYGGWTVDYAKISPAGALEWARDEDRYRILSVT